MAKKKRDILKEQLAPASGVETVPGTPEAVPEAAGAIQPTPPSEAVPQQEGPEGPRDAGAEAQASPAEDSPAETAPATWLAEVRSPKGLNLREGPALSYEVLEVLPDGAEVTALDLPKEAEVPGWRLVYTGERAGWVQRRFLRLRY